MLAHFFLPHHTNNYRPKALHHTGLFTLILLLAAFVILVRFINLAQPSILGFATDIQVDQLLILTNKEREKAGLSPVVLNPQLSEAAKNKAEDMFEKGYWAHNSPDGNAPWGFIINSGYRYIYAGENLARDFSDTQGVVEAWMASPGHKDNILSSNYQDIGFAVVNGKLDGQDTTLIVQLFGSRKEVIAQLPKQVFGTQEEAMPVPLINIKLLTRNTTLSVLGVLIFILTVDMIIATRRRLVRFVGHNLDHVIFLASFVIIIISSKGGAIL